MDLIVEQLKEQNENSGNIDLKLDNFICLDWNVYYNLYNPENFEDPENSPQWYDVNDVYEYYEKPYSSAEKATFYSSRKIENFDTLSAFINESEKLEKELLNAIVKYTFGDGGAYAASKHFQYAKKTMENLHNVKYTEETFLKRNLCIDTIAFGKQDDELELHFYCSWDEEHGLTIKLKNNKIISFE